MSLTIPEHSGQRLEALSRDELLQLMKMRTDAVEQEVNGQHDCPPNRISPIASLIEVLNAILVAKTKDGKTSTNIWPDGLAIIKISQRKP